MLPFDIRSLPPTFRRLSLVSTDITGMTLSAGSFDGVIPRGDDRIRGLSTTYAGIPFNRITYAGIDTTIGGVTSSFYGSQSNDLWNQYYASLSKNVAIGNDPSLTGRFDSYITRATGARSEGDIDNRSASLSMTVQRGASSVLLGYQLIGGDQFFDYAQETSGMFLANAMGVDDPAWFLMFGSFAALGARVVGIPLLSDDPDLVQLAQLAALHKPKLYFINSVLQNPTSTSLSAAQAFQVLRLAEKHGFAIIEDDIYCDLHAGSVVQPGPPARA